MTASVFCVLAFPALTGWLVARRLGRRLLVAQAVARGAIHAALEQLDVARELATLGAYDELTG